MTKILYSLTYSIIRARDNYMEGRVRRRAGVLEPSYAETINVAPPAFSYLASRGTLPASVDLRPKLTPIRDQGSTSECVAYALAAVKEHQDSTGAHLSPKFIYKRRTNPSLEGMVMLDAVRIVQSVGVCTERAYGTSEELPNAANHRIAQYSDVRNLIALKGALAQGKIAFIALPLYPDSPENRFWSRAGKRDGSHAVAIVGYDDLAQTLLIRNSWGTGWGNKGYGPIPYTEYAAAVMEAYVVEDQDGKANPEPADEKKGGGCCIIS